MPVTAVSSRLCSPNIVRNCPGPSCRTPRQLHAWQVRHTGASCPAACGITKAHPRVAQLRIYLRKTVPGLNLHRRLYFRRAKTALQQHTGVCVAAVNPAHWHPHALYSKFPPDKCGSNCHYCPCLRLVTSALQLLLHREPTTLLIVSCDM